MPPVRTAPRRATYDGLPPLIDLPDDFNQVPCYTHERCVRLLDLIGGPCAPLHPAGPARGKGSFSGWRKVLALKLQDRVERMCSVPHQRVTGYEGKLLDTREDNYEAMLRAYVGERAKDIVRSIRHRLSEAQAKATKGVDAAECGAYDLRALFVLFSEGDKALCEEISGFQAPQRGRYPQISLMAKFGEQVAARAAEHYFLRSGQNESAAEKFNAVPFLCDQLLALGPCFNALRNAVNGVSTYIHWSAPHRTTWITWTAECIWGLARAGILQQPNVGDALRAVCARIAQTLPSVSFEASRRSVYTILGGTSELVKEVVAYHHDHFSGQDGSAPAQSFSLSSRVARNLNTRQRLMYDV